jgi:hypothetical protein
MGNKCGFSGIVALGNEVVLLWDLPLIYPLFCYHSPIRRIFQFILKINHKFSGLSFFTYVKFIRKY